MLFKDDDDPSTAHHEALWRECIISEKNFHSFIHDITLIIMMQCGSRATTTRQKILKPRLHKSIVKTPPYKHAQVMRQRDTKGVNVMTCCCYCVRDIEQEARATVQSMP